MFKIPPQAPATPAPAAIEKEAGERLTLGTINERIAPIKLTADALRELGFEPAGRERAAVLYLADDPPAICGALIDVLESAREACAFSYQ